LDIASHHSPTMIIMSSAILSGCIPSNKSQMAANPAPHGRLKGLHVSAQIVVAACVWPREEQQ
jgi:hypothetical protein